MGLDYDKGQSVLVPWKSLICPRVGARVEPEFPGVKGTTAPTSFLQFKFSRVGHSFHS